MSDLIKGLLQAPATQLDDVVKPKIEKWDDPPTALQVLEVLDIVVYDALASSFVVKVLEVVLDMAIKRENTTYEAVVAQATWRKKS
jgi:hypothetical protein